MVGQKYVALLSILSQQECKQLELALKQKYGDDSQEMLDLFQVLKAGGTEAEMWTATGQDTSYQASKHSKFLARKIHEFREPTEDILLQERLKTRKKNKPPHPEDPFLRQRLLLQILKSKDAPEIVAQQYRELDRQIGSLASIRQGEEIRSAGSHALAAHQLRYEMEDARIHSSIKVSEQEIEQAFPQLDESLNVYLLHAALLSVSQYKRYERTSISEASNHLKGILLDHVQKFSTHYEAFPLIAFYQKLCHLQTLDAGPESIEIWAMLFDMLQSIQRASLLDAYTLYNLFNLLQSEAARFAGQRDKHRRTYLDFLWKLYLWASKSQIILQDGKLGSRDFLLILKLYHLLQEEQVESDMETQYAAQLLTWKDMLPVRIREEVWQVASMVLSFHQGRYDEVIQYGKQIKQIRQADYKAYARVFLCMAHYESWWKNSSPQEDSHALKKELKNLQKILERDKQLEAHTKEGIERFQFFLQRIFHPPRSILQRQVLAEQLYNTKPIYQGIWLMEKWKEIL